MSDLSTKHITLSNLSTFLSNIKSKYASNDDNSYIVGYALKAGKDSAGNQITSTYHKLSDFNTFKTGYDTFYKNTTEFAYDKIHSISLKGSKATTATPLDINKETKNIEIDLSAYALLTDITSVLQFKGTLENLEALNKIHESETIKVGDVYLLSYGATYDKNDSDDTTPYTEKNVEYVCTGISTDTKVPVWEKLGSSYDFSIYAEKDWVKTTIDSKISDSETTTSATINALTSRVSTNETALKTLNGDVNTNGSVQKTATDIATTLTNTAKTELINKINALDYNSSNVTGEFVINVTQTDGLVSVTKGSLTFAVEDDINQLFVTSG